MTADEIIRQVAGEADRFEAPDRQTRYNNTNYGILGRIVEKVTGDDLGAQIHANITRPLA